MIVIDTSGVLALKDEVHPEHRAVGEVIAGADDELLLSPFVLAESDCMLATRLGAAAAGEFLNEVVHDAFTMIDSDSGDVIGTSIAITTLRSASPTLPWWSSPRVTRPRAHSPLISATSGGRAAVGAPAFTLLPAGARLRADIPGPERLAGPAPELSQSWDGASDEFTHLARVAE